MPLITIVKVGNISNLSDARYCSGMGVEMLGFTAVEGEPDYLAPKLYQEIRGWVSGPKVIAQVYGVTSIEMLNLVIQNYVPDYLEMTVEEFLKFETLITIPCIVSVSTELVNDLILLANKNIAYLIIDENILRAIPKINSIPFPVLLKVSTSVGLKDILSKYRLQGVALSGSPEVRPGFKEYGHLSEVLEVLDED